MHPGLTVVIPISDLTDDRCSRLSCCLRSIQRQTYSSELVDVVLSLCYHRGEMPSSSDWARLLGLVVEHQITIVPWSHGLPTYPPALTKNLGGRWGRREALTFVDADAVLHPEAFEVAMEFKGEATTIQTAMTEYPLGASEYELENPWDFEEAAKVWPLAIGTGCCTVTTHRLWEDLGGFDEDFTEWGVMDIDFTDRLKMRGLELKNLTETHGLVNMHQHHDRGGRDLGHRLEHGRREMFDLAAAKKSRGEYTRNVGRGWGGLPVGGGEGGHVCRCHRPCK
jgi:hypothetical protein